ncbi:class I SAM-dependent methyltransferase [Actinopolymorpha pittospori]
MSRIHRRGSYGVDAPFVPLGFAGAAVALTVVGVVATVMRGIAVGWLPFLLAALMVVSLLVYMHATWRGKFQVWSRLLDELGLRGHERLLDIGCGRGAVLLMAAGRLDSGRAVGVDLWRTVDQSGNAQEVTERNAVAEGVSDRVELHTGDMMALPFESDGFDAVVSSLAIHNVRTPEGRARAIDEAVRVLRPGGRLVVTDISATGEYLRRLTALGLVDVRVRPLGWRMWWGGPWMSTRVVSATKPMRWSLSLG